MPAQKRSRDSSSPPPPPPDDDLVILDPHSDDDVDNIDDKTQDSDEDQSSSSSDDDDVDEDEDVKDEFVTVRLAELRKDVQCPICLGIIRKTRTVMECLHRFCRECIDKSMRLGNNECPACRTHCASRRSLRDDPKFDMLIAFLYPDIDKYEAEELAFHEEEKARNKQIQDLIAETSRRQSEALGRKRTSARATAAAFIRRLQGNQRNPRRSRHQKAAEPQGSDNDDESNGNEGGKGSSSDEEPCTVQQLKRYKRTRGARSSQPSLAASSADGVSDENELEGTKESVGVSAGLVSTEMLGWGRGGIRSNNRHGSFSGSNNKIVRNGRISKLLESLRNLHKNDNELDIHLMLASLDEQTIPNLERPILCCSSSLSVRHLCEYVALQTSVEAEEVEMLLVKANHFKLYSSANPCDTVPGPFTIDPSKDELQILEEKETLVNIYTMCNYSQHHLMLAFRKKKKQG